MAPGHRYLKFVESFPPASPSLPLMHVTFGTRFVTILDTLEILPGPVDEILEKAVSFHFYGKPSYRPKPETTFGRSIGSALFCLVLDLAALPSPTSVLPFDSGGYGPAMKPYCDGIELKEFLLPPQRETPPKLVSALFGSNERYFNMTARDRVSDEIERFDLHSQGLVRLYSTDGPVQYDQRAGSIEVHYDAPLTLDRSNVLAVIAPDVVAEEPELLAFAAAVQADVETYPFDLDEPSVRQRQIRDAAGRWLSANGYLGAAK